MKTVATALSEQAGPIHGHVGALDGVRGVAVLLVFLFHLQVFGFAAGYLGVDIFFVLSGFLITSLLLAEAQKRGTIGVTAFWARRARRLLPALVLLLLAVALVTHFTATYSERTSMRADLLATTTYVANWHFITTSSYFNNTGTISSLSHTWSLGIEEQFYLFWPLLLAIFIPITKRPRLTVGVLALVGAVLSGIALALLWSPESVDRAYMGTDARIFEPLIGALGAVLVTGPRGRAQVQRFVTPLIALGTVGLIAGLATIRSGTSVYYFGGAIAISILTVQIVAPLWVGQGGRLLRPFEWKPLAWLGVVSYGIYLWHWPMMIWLGVPGAVGRTRLVRGSLVVILTIGAAALSYYLVELPIRVGRKSGRRVSNDAWQRRKVLAAVPVVALASACVSVAATTVPPPPPGVPVIMLTGDSVPLHLTAAFERAAATRGWRVVSATAGGCPVSAEQPHCQALITRQDTLIRTMHPDIVLWWDRWSLADFVTPAGDPVRSGTGRFWKLRRAALATTVERLSRDGATVVFMATEPPGEGMLTRCTERRCHPWIRFQIDHYNDITSKWNRIMRGFAEQNPDLAAFVSVTDVVCKSDVSLCDDLIDGVPARPDGTHYEGAGEQLVVATVLDLLAPILARPARSPGAGPPAPSAEANSERGRRWVA
jgi:peptidoglycan/LPS O-acetylase OafA/YrhL